MSLGRYLSRYILEPNLNLFSSRKTKLIFASSIFFASALWHGGTVNYVLWGLFHGMCYYIYVNFLKRKDIPIFIGFVSMIFFFVMGRFLAIDSDTPRLLEKLEGILSLPIPNFSALGIHGTADFYSPNDFNGLMMAAVFLTFEAVSLRLYKVHRAYHLFRKPLPALGIFLIFLVFGVDSSVLLYARI